MDKSFMHQSLQMLHCPQCGNIYTNSEVGILQESEMAILATITCAKCQHQSVVTLSLGGSNNAGLISDLKPTEINKFMNADPISTNDLLDAYQFLKKTKGNFNEDFKVTAASRTSRKSKSDK
jgi:NAD-dependent SIR2 family protein deacetylase